MDNLLQSLKKLKPQTEEAEKKRKRNIVFGAIPNFATSIAMAIIGFLHNNEKDCPGKEATQFLITGGCVLGASSVLKFYYLTKFQRLHSFTDVAYPILDFVYFCLVIWGSVEVFGKFLTI